MHKMNFAGKFYPADKKEAEKEIERFIDKKAKKIKAVGAIVPHASWFYSGKCAGKVYSALSPADTIIILGTAHSSPVNSISLEDFDTFFGRIENDVELGKEIFAECENLENNEGVFSREHSIEVQLGFIRLVFPQSKIVPVLVAENYGLAEGLVRVIKKSKKKILILASSDFTHSGRAYGFDEDGERLDKEAIDAIIDLDKERFLEIDSTICGREAISLLIEVSKKLGAGKGKLVEYYDSSSIVKSENKVGYAGMIVN